MMESNKDEAIRCTELARDALRSGDKQKASRLLRIARRLDPDVPLDDLPAPTPRGGPHSNEENARLIREIRTRKDHYEVLGVERGCSGEDIRKAYRRLSLRVHPDKNRALGSEEAFKVLSTAFKCLSDKDSRREYDRGMRKRRVWDNDWDRNDNCHYEGPDADDAFRSFHFGSGGHVYRAHHAARRPPTEPPREWREEGAEVGEEFNFGFLIHLVPFLVMFLVLCLPFSEPGYALQRNYTFQIPKVVEKYGVEYYVKSAGFDEEFPRGSPARASLERNVVKDYRSMLSRYCRVEMQRRQWARSLPTPHCDKLRNFAVA